MQLENVLVDAKGNIKITDFNLSALPQHFRVRYHFHEPYLLKITHYYHWYIWPPWLVNLVFINIFPSKTTLTSYYEYFKVSCTFLLIQFSILGHWRHPKILFYDKDHSLFAFHHSGVIELCVNSENFRMMGCFILLVEVPTMLLLRFLLIKAMMVEHQIYGHVVLSCM